MLKMSKLICAAILAVSLTFTAGGAADGASRAEISRISVNRRGTNFHYWQDNAVPKQKLIQYVKAVTDSKSKDFIPVDDRIAVFDMDGTIIGETTPYYFEWMLYLNRIYNDPSYQASQESIKNAEIIKEAIAKKAVTREIDDMETRDKNIVLAGLNDEQFKQVVQHAMSQTVPGLSNIRYGEEIYLPMMEVLSYLKANNFTLYIVSGGYRQIVRNFAAGVIPVPVNHIIGADTFLRAINQNGITDADYVFDVDSDEIVTTDIQLERNDGMAKADKIAREIGKKPVLSFGNSMGDASMHQYTLSNKRYKTMAFALLCDDVEREYGNPDKAEKIRRACEKYGWIPVSMRNDWKTIYGEDVKRLN